MLFCDRKPVVLVTTTSASWVPVFMHGRAGRNVFQQPLRCQFDTFPQPLITQSLVVDSRSTTLYLMTQHDKASQEECRPYIIAPFIEKTTLTRDWGAGRKKAAHGEQTRWRTNRHAHTFDPTFWAFLRAARVFCRASFPSARWDTLPTGRPKHADSKGAQRG